MQLQPERLGSPEILAADTVEWSLRIPEDLYFFQGHFPQAAIVPGVALTQWAIQFAAEQFQRAAKIDALSTLKFQQVLRPGEEVVLEIRDQPDKGSTQFRYYRGDIAHASGRIHWAHD